MHTPLRSLAARSSEALGPAEAIRAADRADSAVRREPAPYASPYIAGVGIGVVLLLSFVLMGRGLGASGAFSSVVTAAVDASASPLKDWLVFEVIGVAIGGVVSACLAGRLRWTTERGPAISDRRRIVHAFAGGALMGVGAKLARGCTSGLGLTGGATLSVGSWLFVIAAFAGAYAAAPLLRKAWR